MRNRTIGESVAHLRRQRQITQADFAVILRALGSDLTREQVNRIERGQRRVDAVELYVIARALGVPIVLFYWDAGLDDASVIGLPERPELADPGMSDDAAAQVAEQVDPHELSPAGRALVGGNTAAVVAVNTILRAWAEYERMSGREVTPAAERGKRSSLWAEWDADPAGFIARAYPHDESEQQ